MPVSGSNHPLFRAIEWNQHRFSQSNRDAISSYGPKLDVSARSAVRTRRNRVAQPSSSRTATFA